MQLERWEKFTKGEQLGAIASEIMRVKIWQNKDKEKTFSALERTFDLIGSTINDNKWQGLRAMLFWLREELTKLYLGDKTIDLEKLVLAF